MSCTECKCHLSGSLSPIATLSGNLSPIGTLIGTIESKHIITGSLSAPVAVEHEHYIGSYTVTPSAHTDIVLETANKLMDEDVNVLKIPYFETSNTSGYTVYIGN